MGRRMETRELAELYSRLVDLPFEERKRVLDQACAGDRAAQQRMTRLFSKDVPARGRASAVTPRLPEFIGPYRVCRLIGSGGMGTVYECEHPESGERVALKLLSDRDAGPNSRARFARESELLERLEHDAIARIHAVGSTERGCPYIVMGLIEGVPITCYSLRLGRDACVRLMATVCDALHYAHETGVIHRDLKPANVLVTSAGQPSVLDFGIARSVDPQVWQTLDGSIVGTAAYMSPEQALGGEVDQRADIYSLGVLAHEVLAGVHPGDGLTVVERQRALFAGSALPCRVQGALGEAVAAAMSFHPAERPATAAALATALRGG